jgi:hypothetical protein
MTQQKIRKKNKEAFYGQYGMTLKDMLLTDKKYN